MNLVVDMNRSPDWIAVLNAAGHAAVHWSEIGSPDAKDRVVLSWPRRNNHVVFTHDLDFGAILAATNADAPSVVQIRTQDPSPAHCAPLVLYVLRRHEAALATGALVVADEDRTRVRLLPLNR